MATTSDPKDTVILFHPRGGVGVYVRTICRTDLAWITTPHVEKARRFTAEGAAKAVAHLSAEAPNMVFSTAKA